MAIAEFATYASHSALSLRSGWDISRPTDADERNQIESWRTISPHTQDDSYYHAG